MKKYQAKTNNNLKSKIKRSLYLLINSKTFLSEGLNRNLNSKPWCPGSNPKENFELEKTITNKLSLILKDATLKRTLVRDPRIPTLKKKLGGRTGQREKMN